MMPDNDESREPRVHEGILRDYLLGIEHEVTSLIDLEILTEGASPILDVIEDELIEEYVTGEMSEIDRSRFEVSFLFSKRRLGKIRLCAMLLGRPEVAEGLSERIARLRENPPRRTTGENWKMWLGRLAEAPAAPPPEERKVGPGPAESTGTVGEAKKAEQASAPYYYGDAPRKSHVAGVLIALGIAAALVALVWVLVWFLESR